MPQEFDGAERARIHAVLDGLLWGLTPEEQEDNEVAYKALDEPQREAAND